MAPMSSARQDLICLEALYDAPADDRFDALAALQRTGLRLEQAQEWLRIARAEGLVAELEGSLVPGDRPTRRGRAIVEEARQRRSNRSHIRQTAQRNLLRWTDDTGGGNLARFLESDFAWIDGLTLTLEQAAEAARALHEEGLIKARIIGAWGAEVVRADVEILPLGREVVDEHNGDPTAWRARLAKHNALVNIQHNAGSIAIGGHGSTVNAKVTNEIDSDKLGQLVEALVAARGTLALAAQDQDDYDSNLEDLQSGEPSRVQRALTWFGRLGRDIGTNALGGMLAGQALGLLPG
ncbi:hypothetical protein [Cellulomonas septica]|uniref:Uncharacterized protein n=1 Tax=Cellulomonas septica TaxID=285080 RepID=A0ABX1JXI3_9CELL|nr:hypothetical protein [Cellulomonas septica]NKY38015.1 hypothetical protein [Cellulomonas septica]